MDFLPIYVYISERSYLYTRSASSQKFFPGGGLDLFRGSSAQKKRKYTRKKMSGECSAHPSHPSPPPLDTALRKQIIMMNFEADEAMHQGTSLEREFLKNYSSKIYSFVWYIVEHSQRLPQATTIP